MHVRWTYIAALNYSNFTKFQLLFFSLVSFPLITFTIINERQLVKSGQVGQVLDFLHYCENNSTAGKYNNCTIETV